MQCWSMASVFVPFRDCFRFGGTGRNGTKTVNFLWLVLYMGVIFSISCTKFLPVPPIYTCRKEIAYTQC